MSILTKKATLADVKFGHLIFEGLMIEDGTFAIAIPQLSALNLVPPNRSLKQLESLLGMRFSSHQKLRTPLNSKAVSAIDLLEFEKVLRTLDRAGNCVAQEIVDALVGLSLTQLFSDAFKIKFETEERQVWLEARFVGKITRRTFTDAVKEYCSLHPELSENRRKFIYANCTDVLNRAVFGKPAKQLREEFQCSKDNLRDEHDAPKLQLIDRIEDFAMRLVDRGLEPVTAIKEAIAFYLS